MHCNGSRSLEKGKLENLPNRLTFSEIYFISDEKYLQQKFGQFHFQNVPQVQRRPPRSRGSEVLWTCNILDISFSFPLIINLYIFRPFFPGASQHLWSWIPNVSTFQEQPRPTSPNSKPCSPRPRDGQQQQQRPSNSATKGAWRRLAEPYGRRGRKQDVRGLKHVDQGPTSYHGGPYCHHSCYVW